MISIVIPAYNNLESVRNLIRSVYRQFDSTKGEAIVVDDGSQSCNMNALKSEFPELKVIRLEKNKGAASARNEGVKNALYDIIFFLDSDMELCDNAIDEIVKAMSNNKVEAVVGTFKDIPLNRSLFTDYWALLKSYFHSLPTEYSSTFYPAVGVIRKKVFQDVGGFEGKIRGASVEDYEISIRLSKKRYRVLFNPGIMVGVNYKDFFTNTRQSISRSKKWGILFLGRPRFDNHTTTLSQGVANILGFFIFLLMFCSFFSVLFFIPAGLAFILFLYINRGFFKYVFKRRGLVFMFITVILYLVSSFFITIGFLKGASYIFRNEESRRRALYA
ncbi:MAG: glycosyltransferase [Candidatus Omnitrophota bacterium]|nr:glycosyltransferase [Candidatus Omnitrophota bacterium]